ncbi:LysM peptidoglycan-binding domain-containing protein [Bacillus sp. FJAT-22090]|uniref:cell division suppressor protein YneA n=1 Tax=Bacillus sp. FJAT-22090 TaxID=1581038 RepID=UPI00119E03D9|nr:LysM peptidoglycan-binding domain-containing protein [Bacillus sp. FJAT-22090]
MTWLKENYFITLFLGLSVLFLMTFIISNTFSTEEDYQIRIEQGDSLWKLADKFAEDESKDAWINKVMVMNNLPTSHIKAGETLLIPEVKVNFHFNNGTEMAGDDK